MTLVVHSVIFKQIWTITLQLLLGWGELLCRSSVPSLLLPNYGHGEMGSPGQCGDAFLRVPIPTIWQSPGQQLQSAWVELNPNHQWTGSSGFAAVPWPRKDQGVDVVQVADLLVIHWIIWIVIFNIRNGDKPSNLSLKPSQSLALRISVPYSYLRLYLFILCIHIYI